MDDDPFSDWGLKSVQLADRALLNDYFGLLAEPLSDYTFSQLYTWRNSLRILWTEMHGHLCVFANGTGDLTLLLPPIGDTHGERALAASFELMNEYNALHGVPHRTRVEYASEELLSRFDRSRLLVEPMGADYVYDVRRMIDLAGGDLASKRQAKNRFLRTYEHRVETYCAARHGQACLALLEQWKARQDAQHVEQPTASSSKRQKESTATALCIEAAEELGMKGMVVYVKEHPRAGDVHAGGDKFVLRGFTFGENLGREQNSITIEKTDLQTRGLAQYIFSEFCRVHWSGRPLVNVGDDWGLESLAWTKMSYRPIKLLNKFALRREPVIMSSRGVPKTDAPGELARAAAAEGVVPATPVIVRAARKEDVAAAVELEQACFSQNFSLTKRQLHYLQKRESAVFLVAERRGDIVGEGIALVRQHRQGSSGRIYSLAVRAESRGQKIGHQLLQKMIEALCARGVKRVYLEVGRSNAGAVRLYQQNGFRAIGELPDYYGSGEAGLHMMCEVAAEAILSSTDR